MTKKTKINQKSRKILAFVLIFCLLPSSVNSQGESPFGGGNFFGMARGIIDTFGNAITGHMDRKRRAGQMRQGIGQSFAPRGVPSKYFPRCTVAAASPSFPENVCRDDLGLDPANTRLYSEAQRFKKIATDNVAFFDGLLIAGGQESSHPLGLQCIEKYTKRNLQDVQNAINDLERENDRLKLKLKEFRNQNKAFLDKMKEVNGRLKGGGEDMDFLKEFSPSCREIIGASKVADAASKGGLTGLYKGVGGKWAKANTFRNNFNSLAKELNDKKGEFLRRVSSEGPMFLGQQGKSQGDFDGAIFNAAKERYGKFQKMYGRVKEQFPDLPNMDRHFRQNIDQLVKDAQVRYRARIIGNCTSKMRLNPQKVVAGLQQQSATLGSNVNDYKKEVARILQKGSIGDPAIMAEIIALDRKYRGNITYRYKEGGKTVRRPPSAIFTSMVSSCEETMASGEVERAAKEFKDLKRVADTLATDIGNAIDKKVVRCDGGKTKIGHCGDGTMNPSSPNFCLSRGRYCANEILVCRREVGAKVAVARDELKALQNQWNNGLKDLAASVRNRMGNIIAPAIANMMKKISHHTGAQVVEPENKSLNVPEMGKYQGIELLGGGLLGKGDFDNIFSGPIKEDLIVKLKAQKESLSGIYSDYLSKKEQNLRDNREKWNAIKERCTGIEAKMVNAVNEENKRRREQNQEDQDNLRQICARYGLYQQDPTPGCKDGGLAQLYTDAMAASSHLNANVLHHIQKFMEHCNKLNSDAIEEEGEGDSEEQSALKKMCDKHDGSFDEVKESMVSMGIDILPEKYRDDARAFLDSEGSSDEVDIEDLDNGYKKMLQRIHSLVHSEQGDKYKSSTKLAQTLLSGSATKGEVYRKIEAKLGDETMPGFLSSWKEEDGTPSAEEIKDLLDNLNKDEYKEAVFKNHKKAQKIIDHLDGNLSDSDNLCTELNNHAKIWAAKECGGDDDDDDCFNEKLAEAPKKVAGQKPFSGPERIANYIEKKYASSVGRELGELSRSYDYDCVAIKRNEPPFGKPSLNIESIFEGMDRGMFRNNLGR